jgi:hypothetical protein
LISFVWCFVRFSTRGVQKHHKNVLEKIHVKNVLPKKLRRRQPKKLTGKGSGSKHGDDTYVPPRLRGSMWRQLVAVAAAAAAAAGGWAKAVEEAKKDTVKGRQRRAR